jgi:choline-sulfatase
VKNPALPLLLAVLLLCGLAGPGHAARKPRPNVVLIVVDDLNDWIGCLGGHPQALTPNMDRLSREGTLFLNAHCQAPLCNPSRTSFLTGLRPSTTGVYGLDPWFRTAKRLKKLVTLPQYFQRHGYTTLTCGKIFHDAYPPKEERTDGNEFSVWGYQGNYGPSRPQGKFVQTPDPHPLVDWGVFPERDEDQEDWKVADWAVQALRKPPSGPFFLSVGFRRPHLPCYASQKWWDLYPEDKVKLPIVREGDRLDTPRFSWYLHWKLPEPRLVWLQKHDQWKPLVRAYLASTSFVDSQLGRVLTALRESGQADNTIVALISDHGWHLGEKEITGKNSLWEESTRVPMMISAPGLPRSARCQRPVELVDLYPTLLDLCRLPGRGGLDGRSVEPLLRDAGARWEWPAITTAGPNNHGVRTEDWRFIHYADGSEELYDLHKDPHEWNNLDAARGMDAVKRDLARWLPTFSHDPLPGSKTRLIERRKGVWYWEGKPIGPKEPIPMDD